VKAHTTRVDDDRTGLAPAPTWFLSPRRELRGWGHALVVDLPAPWTDNVQRVADALAAIDTTDDVDQPGSGPVAFAALPFDRTAPARFVIPDVIAGTTPDGAHWLTSIDGADVMGAVRSSSAVQAGSEWDSTPATMSVESTVSDDAWRQAVADATGSIGAGRLTKVVLARQVVVRADRPLDATEIGGRLASAHPGAMRFGVDGFVGASPELLVSRVGDVVRAQPMAGTTPRSGDPRLDAQRAAALLASTKNRAEHQITIDMVHDTLLPWCSYLDAEPTPQVAEAGSVQHLATMVEGRLSHPPPSVLDLVATLHPTPAVGGWPREEALAMIGQLEPGDRGRYAGPVGWVDRAGNGAFAVGIRSADISDRTATCFAGVGVVADSDPQSELDETRAKFAATLPFILQI
jgi:menaquinone-specific isochorismate synthase